MITCLGLAPALDVTYLVRSLRRGEIHRPQRVLALPGGKSLNVARALRLLGSDVRAIAPLGGATGERVRDGAVAAGVPLEMVHVDAETRMCVSIVDEATDRITEVYEEPGPLTDDEWRSLAAAIARTATGWLAVSGSMPRRLVPGLVGVLRELSPDVALAIDTHGAPLAALLDSCAPAIVKVNRREAEALLGPVGSVELCVRLRDRGARTAIVTEGARGSVVSGPDATFRVTGPSGGRYTVGAGDCFLAGLLDALGTGSPLEDAAAAATSTAVANTRAPGAACFDQVDVTTAAQRVTVARLG